MPRWIRTFLPLAALLGMLGSALAQPVITNPTGNELLQINNGGATGAQMRLSTASPCAFSSAGCTASGPITAPSVNATGTAGYQLTNGGAAVNGLSISSATSNIGMMVGPGAGASLPAGYTWALGGGWGSMASLTGSYENTGWGTLSCNQLTTGQMDTCLGLHTIGFEQTASNDSATGTDAIRNMVGGGSDTADGVGSCRNGKQTFIECYGVQSGGGNAGSITLGGSVPSAGTLIPITLTSAVVPGMGTGVIANYTVQTGDTLSTIASGIANAINALNINYQGVTLSAFTSVVTGGPPVVGLDFPGTASTGWNVTLSTTYSGTMTVAFGTGAADSGNLFFGFQTAYGAAMTSAGNLAFFGNNEAPWVTTASNGVLDGAYAGAAVTSDSNFVGVGFHSASSQQGSQGWTSVGAFSQFNATGAWNATFGAYSGFGITTGNSNLVLSSYCGTTACENGITTGSANINISAAGGAVQSPTASDQLNIANAILGTANSGSGTALSNGQIGIETLPVGTYTSVALGGEVIVGTGSALATSATAGFLHLSYTTAAPTGTPANVLGDACVINTATESLNCYIGSSWYHVALSSGAN